MFKDYLVNINWEKLKNEIYSSTYSDVERVIKKNNRTLSDFKVLLSPAAENYIEQLAQISHNATIKKFGKTIQLYIPLYLSNECQNICTYCGFSLTNKIPRKTLTFEQILKEVKYIKSKGHDHILLVTGEANKKVGIDYLAASIKLIRPYFSQIAIEVQPLSQLEYELLITHGVDTVLVYQETYHKEKYQEYHPKGKKSNFNYRLQTPDRLGKAGINKIGLGVLLGLEDWRIDSYLTALHIEYLQKKYWKTQFSISFPRLRPYQGGDTKKYSYIQDRELIQLIISYRILFNHIDISLSTRESQQLRNNLIPLGITTMSAESKTNPGGYIVYRENSLEQFETSDRRTTENIIKVIIGKGYQPIIKNWQRGF